MGLSPEGLLRSRRFKGRSNKEPGVLRMGNMAGKQKNPDGAYKNPDGIYKNLIEAALNAREASYSPYSHFMVGAALLCKSGRVYTGCNIENAAYTPSNCAERTAFFKAVSEGNRDFRAIAVAGGPESGIRGFCPPCGVCRQVMREFCDPKEFEIILAAGTGEYKVYKLEELLPEGFGPDQLIE